MNANVVTEKYCKGCAKNLPATREFWHWSKGNSANCVHLCKTCMSDKRHPNKKTTSQKFWNRVDKSDGEDSCWEWTGARHYRGYGKFGKFRRLHEVYAHRFAWTDINGEIPDGIEVRHKCDNPPCVNPKHLELGTHLDNMSDMVKRKRLPDRSGENSYTRKLTKNQVLEIRGRLLAGETQKSIASDYGIKPVTVAAINTRRIWKLI